jgi:hypothetical protein
VILATVTVGMLLRKCSIVNREMVLKALRAYGSQVYNSLKIRITRATLPFDKLRANGVLQVSFLSLEGV